MGFGGSVGRKPAQLAFAAALMAGAVHAEPLFAQTQLQPEQNPESASPDDKPSVVTPEATGTIAYLADFFAGSGPNTALDILLRLPGFSIDFGNSATRGLSGAGGNVLIDGDRPTSKSDGLNEILTRISAASVDRVELVRGGAPGIDMQGRSVIANIVLKATVTRELAVEANSYAYPDGFFGPSAKVQYSRRAGDDQTELSAFVTHDRTGGTSDGDRTRSDSSGATFQIADLDLNDRFDNGNVRGVIQRSVGRGKLRLNALIDYTAERSDQTISVRSGAPGDSRADDQSSLWSGELGVTFTRPLGPRTEAELTLLQRADWTDYDSNSRVPGSLSTFAIDSRSTESIGRGVWRFRPKDEWAIEAGGEVAYNVLDSDTTFSVDGDRVALPNASVRVSELRGEVFGQLTWTATKKLTIEAAVRAETSIISQVGDTNLSRSFFYPKPRLQLSWQFAKHQQLRFRIERQVGQLDFDDFVASTEVNLGTVIGGNAQLRPQKTTIFEGVYDLRFWSKAAFTLTAQYARLNDVIELIPLDGAVEAVGNIGDGTVELIEARLTLPLDKIGVKNAQLRLRASGQWTDAVDPLTGRTRPLGDRLPFACGIEFDHDLAGGKYSYGFEHGCNIDRLTSYRIRELRRVGTQPYVSVYAQVKPRSDLTVRLDLGNIFDAEAVTTRSIYSGERELSPLLFIERRALGQGPFAYLQLRKVL